MRNRVRGVVALALSALLIGASTSGAHAQVDIGSVGSGTISAGSTDPDSGSARAGIASSGSAGSAGSSGSSDSAGSAGSVGSSGSAGSSGSTSESAGSAAGPTANAHIVGFGDSFTSNSNHFANVNYGSPLVQAIYPSNAGCLYSPNSWPMLLARDTGRPVQNWACNGHTTADMLRRIEHAASTGALDNASTVILAAGMNDTWGSTPDIEIVDNLVTAVDKVRGIAPEAKILMLGRLSSTNDREMFCSLNVIPNVPMGIHSPGFAAHERRNQANQRDAALRADVEFLDIRELSRANSTCAPDAQRYIAGNVDFTTHLYNMTGHPSLAGSTFLARQVSAHI